jgi:hypothetical protein
MADSKANPIIIFASGQRCGSTLLQRWFCSHPQVMIWGEHNGVLKSLFENFDQFKQWEQMFRHQFTMFKTDGFNNFIPNMNPAVDSLRQAQMRLVESIWADSARALNRPIWGFKEVLYGAEMVFALRELFPAAKFIHLTRNIFECFISLRHEERIAPEMQPHVPIKQVWTRQRTLEFIATWTRVNRSLLEAEGFSDTWFTHLRYEDLVDDPATVTEQLADWLGLKATDFALDVFNYKLYTDRHKGPDTRPEVARQDLSPAEVALVTTEEILYLSSKLNYDMTIC